MQLLRELFLCFVCCGFNVSTKYVHGNENGVADALSRFNVPFMRLTNSTRVLLVTHVSDSVRASSISVYSSGICSFISKILLQTLWSTAFVVQPCPNHVLPTCPNRSQGESIGPVSKNQVL